MTYVFISTETGGLVSSKHALLKLAAVVTNDDFTPIDEFVTYINPDPNLEIDPEAISINKIEPKDLKNAPNELEVISKFNELLNKHNHPYIAGANMDFVLSFINTMCLRNLTRLDTNGMFTDIVQTYSYQTKKAFFKLFSACKDSNISPNKNIDKTLSKCYLCVELAKKVLQ